MKENSDYDLEEKINLLYDYFYNINTKNCFSFEKITLGKIGLDDIKISLPKDDDDYYDKIKKDILGGKFKFLSYDDDNNIIYLKRYSDQFPVTIKISFYKDNKLDTFDNEINNDSLFSYLLSDLVLAKKTKHILLPIMNYDINFSDIEKIVKNESAYDVIKNKIENNEITDNCCVQIREHFFKTISLLDYLKENKCSVKNLLFQIIHTLATIQNNYNEFRHNDLRAKNIMIYLKKKLNSFTEYEGFKNDNFYLQNSEFDIKIGNFENSIIPKHYGLFNSQDKSIPFASEHNPYYDLYTILNDVLKEPTILNFGEVCDSKTEKFLEKIIPRELRGENKIKKNVVIAIPKDLLYDDYFKEFRTKPTDNAMEETITNHLYLTGKKYFKNKNIETILESDNGSILGQQYKISNTNIMTLRNTNSRTLKNDENHMGERIIRRNIDEEDFNSSSDNKVIKGGSRQIKNEKIVEDLDDVIYKNMSEIYSKQNGGDGKPEILPYKAERNNPFVSNDQRETFKKKAVENPVREPPILLEQKIYDTAKQPPQKSQFPPSFIPLYDQDGQAASHLLPYSKVINQPPVQKVYNISLTNPIGNYTSLNRVYEDVLPGNPFTYSAVTVFERRQLVDFMRNNVLDAGDGEEMHIVGGKNSLLSYVKVMDINPYSISKNPYMELARNFILYRAAYPVRFDERNKLINIAKSSMGINIRMYMLSRGDLRCKTINNFIDADNFDIWREMKYYDYVRDNIIKRKVSPNFICPILYKIDSESKIDWGQLNLIKDKGIPRNEAKQIVDNARKINDKHKLKKNTFFDFLLPVGFRPKDVTIDVKVPQEARDNLENALNDDITVNSGKVLILLTEAPTSSLRQWCTPVYESYGSVKKMVSTGYHTPDVWKSILFQLTYAMAVMQEAEIYMQNFTMDNIFIKDVFSDPNSIGSWIYSVDNVKYYIPNYGHILLLDSRFADIDVNRQLIQPVDKKNQEFKLYSKIFKNNLIWILADTKDKIKYQFMDIINSDNFNRSHRIKGGSVPDESILDLMQKIYLTTSTSTNLKDLIPKYFSEFVHNRVGTLLTKTERDNINMFSRPNFKTGNLMVYQKRFQEYEWIIYKKQDESNPLKSVIIKKENNITKEESVFTHSLFGYPEDEPVLPISTRNMKYDEGHILETYKFEDLI